MALTVNAGDTALFTGHRLSQQSRQHIRDIMWPESRKDIRFFASYFRYFEQTLSMAAYPNLPGNSEGQAMKTISGLKKFVGSLRMSKTMNKMELATKIQRTSNGCELANVLRSLDLTALLWLCLHFESDKDYAGGTKAASTPIEWDSKVSLKNAIEKWFPVSSDIPNAAGSPIDPDFTALNLMRLCRIRIEWTDSLMNHLKYDSCLSTLYIYSHKICLISHLESSDIFPRGFLLETLETLDILFPFSDTATRKYLDKKQHPIYELSYGGGKKKSDLKDFYYWRKRLVDLHEIFHQPPKTIMQSLYDRRNPIQWWTFWLAVFIAILTILNLMIAIYAAVDQHKSGIETSRLAKDANRLLTSQLCFLATPSNPAVCHDSMIKKA